MKNLFNRREPVAASRRDVAAPTSKILRFGRGAELPRVRSDDESLLGEALTRMTLRVHARIVTWVTEYAPEAIPETRTDALVFVRRVVLATEPENTFSASLIGVAVSGLVCWAVLRKGLPLRPSVLFSTQVLTMHIEWLAGSGKSTDTVRNYRKYLERAADALGMGASEHAVSFPGKKVAAPYSPERESMLESWARAQPTQLGLDRALALLGLGAGAGLTNAEILNVTARHIIDAAGTLWVRVVGDRDRLVLVRERWAPHLRARVAKVATWDDHVFPMGDAAADDVVESWLGRSRNAARPTAGRLRSTFIVANLRDRVKPEQLVEWSGVSRGETLVPYLAFVPEVATEDLRRALMHLRTPSSGGI